MVVFLLAANGEEAHATIVTYAFSGTMIDDAAAGIGLHSGATISGKLTYDTTTSAEHFNQSDGSTTYGQIPVEPPSGFDLSIGGHDLSTPASSMFVISVQYEVYPELGLDDGIMFGYSLPVHPAGLPDPVDAWIVLGLFDSSRSVFSSQQIPTFLPQQRFDEKQITIGWQDKGGNYFKAYGDLSSFKLVAVPGDANLSGVVDGADYTQWADHFLQTNQNWGAGDFNGDGIVDGADYTLWADNFAPVVQGLSVVPEPAGLTLQGVGLAALVAVARRARVRRADAVDRRVRPGTTCTRSIKERSTITTPLKERSRMNH